MVGVDYKLERRQRKAKNRREVTRVGRGNRDLRLNTTGWDPELITASEQAIVKPVIHIARLAYAIIKRRTFKQGRSAKGKPWGSYSARVPASKRTDRIERENGHLWIGPQKPQPKIGKYPIRIKSGDWRGWALYESSRQYAEAQRKSGINFVNTGTLAQGMQIRPLSPLNIKIAFYGGRRKTHDRILGGSGDASGGRRKSKAKNNSSLARILSSKGYPLIEVNRKDRIEILRLMQTLITPELLDLLRAYDDVYKGRKALRIRDRALQKVKRQFEDAERRIGG
jgi:hypothetical protein